MPTNPLVTDYAALDHVALVSLRTQTQAALVEIEKELARRRDTIAAELRRDFAARAAEYGLSVNEILRGIHASSDTGDVFANGGDGKSPAKKLPPKYRDPITGQTWTGKGFVPAWMKTYITRPDGSLVPAGPERKNVMAQYSIRQDITSK